MEIVRGLGDAVNLNCFSDEIHGLPPLEKFININVLSNIDEINNQQVGLVQPESTPVEIATSSMLGMYPYMQMSIVESGSSKSL
jgi:hypothetical protein